MHRGEDRGAYGPKYEIKPHSKREVTTARGMQETLLVEGLHLDYLSEGGGEKRK